MQDVMQYVYIIIVILLSLSFHEFSHAFVSDKLGDPTARDQGRLSLNPLKHLDPLGTIMMVASMIGGAGIGWAKPVPINPMYYKNKKAGTMLVSTAGPLSNLLLSFVFVFPFLYIGSKFDINTLDSSDLNLMIFSISRMFVLTNINLAVFNLLPVPPLDGSKILSGILPTKQYYQFMQYENYIGIAFILVIFVFPGVLRGVLKAVTIPVSNIMVEIAIWIFRLFGVS